MAKAAEKLADEMEDDTDDMIINFSEDISQAEAPDALPAGEYSAQIRAAVAKISTTSGNKYAEVRFYISPEEYPADFDPQNAPDGVTISFRRVLLEDNAKSRFYLRRFCEAIGATMSSSINLSEWIGLDARVTVEHEKDQQGLDREQITRVNPA